MAEISTDLIVRAISEGFDRMSGDMRELAGTAERVGDGIEQSGKGAQSASLRWTELMSSVSLVQQGYAAVANVAQETYQALTEGAQLELARSQFDNLAASVNSTGDAMLGKLREATNGLATDAQLVEAASGIISTGLAKNEEDVTRLANVVTRLGLDMQQVILTFANDSTMRLDSLGLSVEGVTERQKELNEAGHSMSEAFDLAVLEGLENRVELLGDASESTAGQLKQMEVAVQNAQDAFKLAFAEDFGERIGDVGDTAEDTSRKLELLGSSLGENLIPAFLRATEFAFPGFQDALREIDEWLDKSVDGQKELEDRARVGADIIDNYTYSVEGAADANEELGDSAQSAGEKIERAIGPADEFSRRLEQLNRGVGVRLTTETDTEPARQQVEDFITELSGRALEIQLAIRGQENVWDQLGIAPGGATAGQQEQFRQASSAMAEQFASNFNAVLQEKLTGEWTGETAIAPTVDDTTIDPLAEKLGLVSETMGGINETEIAPRVVDDDVVQLHEDTILARDELTTLAEGSYSVILDTNLSEENQQLGAFSSEWNRLTNKTITLTVNTVNTGNPQTGPYELPNG